MIRPSTPAIFRTLSAGVCAALLAAGAANAAPQAHYEATVLQGVASLSAGMFRINVATGQTLVTWGANTQFNPVMDNTPIPAGDYHIQVSSWVADGKVLWDVYRIDTVTGRTWTGIGGGPSPVVWNEVVAPK